MTEPAPVLRGTTRPTPQDGTATYVFAVCARLDRAVLTGLPGLAERAPVRALPFGRLVAVVQSVRADEFGEEAWERRLADRDDLERCARAHHEVVSAAAACGPTVPLALATLYRGDDRARDALSNDADRFHTVLRRIEGHVEWGVKVYTSPTPDTTSPPLTPAAHHAPAARETRPAPGAGRAYLDRKRGLHEARERRQDETLRAADAVDTALCRLATASRRLQPHGRELTGERRTQVLNAAYLVAENQAAALADAVETLRRKTGTQIDVTGPWVPYSFAGEV